MSSIILAAASAMNSASISNSVTTTDPYAANTVLLLNGEGAIDGAQNNTFVDSSGNNLAITRYGNVTQGSFSPFPVNNGEYNPAVHGGSAYFDGTGDYLSTGSVDLSGNTPFTIELWVLPSATQTSNIPLFLTKWGNPSSAGDYFLGFTASTGKPIFAVNLVNSTYSFRLDSSVAMTMESWNYLTISRNASYVYTMTLNGNTVATGTYSTMIANNVANLVIGRQQYSYDNYGQFTGYISNLRIVKGTALYTSNFTPSTTPLTAVPGTSLLLNFTNAGIKDLTGKNNLETVGNAQISTGVKKYGSGAMYFDGTGDYLSIPVNNNLNFGTGDFTIELWRNAVSPTSDQGLFSTVATGSGAGIGITNLRVWLGSNATVNAYIDFPSTVNNSPNTWRHFAITLQSGTLRAFVDGVVVGTVTSTLNITNTTAVVGSKYTNNFNYLLNGYIDDLRITKGVARYTANFTPPNESLYLSKAVSNEVYGIDWNPTTDMYTRTGVAAGTSLGTSYNGNIQSRMKRCVLNSNGTVKYYLNPTNSTKKEDGTTAIIDGSDGNVMVEIPKFYYKYENVSGVHKWSISPVPSTGYTVHPAFIKAGVEVANRYYPAYEGYNLSGRLISGSGRTPTVSQTRATFRGYARANGTGWGLIDWNILTAVQLLFVTEYGTFNTQNILGNGNDTGSDYTMVTGGSNSIGNASSPATNDDTWMSYRGIENWYASMWKFIDGVNVSERRYFVSNNPTTFADDVFSGDYINTGITSGSSNGYVTNFVASGLGFVPNTVGGTTSTYVGDYFYQSTGNRVVLFGGSAADGLYAGGFFVSAALAASAASSLFGSGVCF